MPTFTGNPFSGFFKRILQFGHAGNNGTPTSTTNIQSGDGVATSISLSDDVLSVQPVNDDGNTMIVKNQSGSNILAVDTTNSKVLMGASQVPPTLFKEMGLYDFSPTAGVHNPLIANNMMFSDSGDDIIKDDSMFGNGADPAATLDLSADGTAKIAVACYWYMDNDITLDSVRYALTTDGGDNLAFHLESYTLDTSTNLGDLSAGTTNATVVAVAGTSTSYKTGTLTLNLADIDSGKVVIGFVESDSTTDLTCTLNIKYHII